MICVWMDALPWEMEMEDYIWPHGDADNKFFAYNARAVGDFDAWLQEQKHHQSGLCFKGEELAKRAWSATRITGRASSTVASRSSTPRARRE